GNQGPANTTPIATAYAGHQFGGWNPQLGDGRAVLLGEVIGRDGNRYDIQLKGAGRTAYSRGGDGRSPLGPVLREYIVSEAMAALGVPTTRSLAAVASGDKVFRDSVLPGGVLTRVASSHIRIGTFQFFAGREDIEAVRALADHVIARHFPFIENGPDAVPATNPYFALLENVIARQAHLIALWQSIGFIHGVMNTDNMLLSGETIDYGPCAFMDNFNPATVYSSIDARGRYAYQNQPAIAQWNVSWLAQSLLPLFITDDTPEAQAAGVEMARAALSRFGELYQTAYYGIMLRKLGLTANIPENLALVNSLLELMTEHGADYTLTFRRLAELVNPAQQTEASVVDIFELPEGFQPWLAQWQAQLASEHSTFEHSTSEQANPAARQQTMFALSPVFIPRNHLIAEAIQAAETANDFQPFQQLVDILANPYRYDPQLARYATPPRPDQVVAKTFCGT
ncbi:MAG: protein adenylyltransferase SelO, partial [Spongiibacteraceae bacterium]